MKLVLYLLFFISSAMAKPTVLVSYFNPYGGAKVNNSETVAKILIAKAQTTELPFEIKTCQVQTKFDVSFQELQHCLNTLPEAPVLVISLGETGCDLKIEMMARNLDKTFGPDNAGIERKKTSIIKDAPEAIGYTYPLAEMYCGVEASLRKKIVISNNAGSFVCNNLGFQTAWNETGLSYGLIHVPAHTCRDLSTKNENASEAILAMIKRGTEVLSVNPTVIRLPVRKTELEVLRSEEKSDHCLADFWKKAKGIDEKNSWPF